MALSKSFIRNAAMAPLDARLANMALLVSNNDGTPRTGVLGNASASIVTTTGTTGPMTVNVAAAEFATSKGKADGVSIFTNDGTTAVTISAAPGTNSRITSIWVKHEDNTTGDAASLPIFGTTDGAAAASPVAPAIPTGAEELAQLRVFAGTTASNGGSNVLTNTYRMTATRGGVVPFRTTTERDAWTNPVDGQQGFVIAADATYQFLATALVSGWHHMSGAPEVAAITAGGLWQTAAAGGTPQTRRQAGFIMGAGSFQNIGVVNVTLGTEYIIANISNALMRPDVDRYFATGTTSNATGGVIRVAANGDIGWRANATASWGAGLLRIDLGGIIYTAKALA